MLVLDGSYGEGGGQIVRTAVTLSCITGTPVQIDRIRAGRKPRGLRAQHITAIQAAADICRAEVTGLEQGSESIQFVPQTPPRSGLYRWSVGTAGAASLVLQTVLVPLILTNGRSTVEIHGGTHVTNSPPGHYIRDVYLPLLLSMGADVEVYIESYGWYPEGGGTISAAITGGGRLAGLDLRERGPLERIFGTAVSCNLPSHIPQRMATRALNLLSTALDAPLDIRPLRTSSISTGAGIFLAAEYTNGRGGFSCLGRKGMPSEAVAEQAITDLLAFHASDGAVDQWLADQLILPMALASTPGALCTDTISAHCRTNLDVVRAFLPRPIELKEQARTIVFGS